MIASVWAIVCLLATSPVQFTDIARSAGLNDIFYCGGDTAKKYIIETLGGGVALFDYDNDGYVDAFFVTGSVLEGFPTERQPTNQLYRNNHDGTFTRVTTQAGLAQSGWGQEIGRHTSELQSHSDLVCRLLLEKKKKKTEQNDN